MKELARMLDFGNEEDWIFLMHDKEKPINVEIREIISMDPINSNPKIEAK